MIPVYSPMFNPIEMCFSKIKSNFRKLKHIIDSINKITESDLTNYYSHVCKTITEYATA